MNAFLKKITSRKFILSLIAIVSGIAGLFVVENGTVGLVASVILIVAPTLTYVITEGKLDEAGIKKIVDAVGDVIEVVKSDENTTLTGGTISGANIVASYIADNTEINK